MGKLKVAADTGALVSITLSGMLNVCTKHFDIIIGKRIKSELEEISQKNDDLAEAAKEILTHIGEDIEIGELSMDFKEGEFEALKLLEEKNADILISDDIAFAKKQNDERIAFSVILLGILYERKIFDRGDFIEAINSIFRKRRWEENQIYLIAMTIIEEK